MNAEQRKIIADKFADIAARYCQWFAAQPFDGEAELRAARALLLELYLEICSFPELNTLDITDKADGQTSIREFDQLWLKRRFAHLPFVVYWFPAVIAAESDAAMTEPRAYLGDFLFALSGIAQNLRDGLELYRKDLLDDALWEWRFSFQISWGKYSIEILAAIHDHFARTEFAE